MKYFHFPKSILCQVLCAGCFSHLIIWYHTQGLCSEPGLSRQAGTQIHSVTPSSAHCTCHLHRTWFLAFIFSSLKKPNTLHVSLLPWVLIWFFYFIWFFKKIVLEKKKPNHGHRAKDEKNVQRKEDAEKEEKSLGAKKRERREEAANGERWREGGCHSPWAESLGSWSLGSGFTLGPSCLDSPLVILCN